MVLREPVPGPRVRCGRARPPMAPYDCFIGRDALPLSLEARIGAAGRCAALVRWRRAQGGAQSLVISRRLTSALGEQTYQPATLRGLIPAALLETYELWQCAGIPSVGTCAPLRLAASSLRAELRDRRASTAAPRAASDSPTTRTRRCASPPSSAASSSAMPTPTSLEGDAAAVSAATGGSTRPSRRARCSTYCRRRAARRSVGSPSDDAIDDLLTSSRERGAARRRARRAAPPTAAPSNVDLLEPLHLVARGAAASGAR